MDTAYKSRIHLENSEYETFLTANGDPAGDVAWLRKEESKGKVYRAGMWRCGVSEAPYYFAADETFVMIEGVLQIQLEGGKVMRFGPGETGSFVEGANSVWTVIEPVLHFFIQTSCGNKDQS